MRANQKFFSLRDPASGRITGYILVANRATSDEGITVLAGNARVLTARLTDAEFFWHNDLRTPLEAMAQKLDAVTFHGKLGTQGERIARIAALAREIAPSVGADPDLAERAAKLAKADLASQMVYEFPELQGTMGRYYAERAGEEPAVAAAAEEHYSPLGSVRCRADRASLRSGGAGGQARHADGILGDRREADRFKGSFRTPPCGSRRCAACVGARGSYLAN